MSARLLPLVAAIAVLGGVSGILLATVGASGPDRPAEAQGDGRTVAGVCAEGFEDCEDMVVVPADGDEEPGPPPPVGDNPAPDLYDVAVRFTKDVTDADLDRAREAIRGVDPAAGVFILESFPPIASARIFDEGGGGCALIIEQLTGTPAVGDVTCLATTDDVSPSDPDTPVTNEP